MNRINIAICGDRHVYIIKAIEDHIEEVTQWMDIDFDIHIFPTAEDLYHAIIREKREFEIFFLPISVDNPVGIDIGMAIRRELGNYDASVFYISPYQHFYEQLFDLQPYYYLQTPIDSGDFNRKFLSALNRLQNQSNLYAFQKNKSTTWVKQKNIVFLESKSRYLVINYFREDTLVSVEYIGTLKNEISKFNPVFFIRPHSSYIVNLDYVVEFCAAHLKLINEISIPISKNRNDITKKHLENYFNKNAYLYF